VAISIVKGCENKEYIDGNAAMKWYILRKNYESTSDPSIVKTEKMLRKNVQEKQRH
jgi:hypothetical protein